MNTDLLSQQEVIMSWNIWTKYKTMAISKYTLIHVKIESPVYKNYAICVGVIRNDEGFTLINELYIHVTFSVIYRNF